MLAGALNSPQWPGCKGRCWQGPSERCPARAWYVCRCCSSLLSPSAPLPSSSPGSPSERGHLPAGKPPRRSCKRGYIEKKNSYLLDTCYLNVLVPQLFQRNRNDINACNNIRDILYNTDIVNSIVKLIVHSPMGKPAFFFLNLCVCMCFCGCLFFRLISPRCEKT